MIYLAVFVAIKVVSWFLCQEEQFSSNGGVLLELRTFSATKASQKT